MRVELRDGLWVELRERITHGQDKEIRRARVRTMESPSEAAADDITVALRVFIKAWNMTDADGASVSLEDVDAIERMPADLADELVGHVLPLYLPATVPNSPTPPSSDDSSTPTAE